MIYDLLIVLKISFDDSHKVLSQVYPYRHHNVKQ